MPIYELILSIVYVILAVFLMFQKYFTQGITMGAVKG